MVDHNEEDKPARSESGLDEEARRQELEAAFAFASDETDDRPSEIADRSEQDLVEGSISSQSEKIASEVRSSMAPLYGMLAVLFVALFAFSFLFKGCREDAQPAAKRSGKLPVFAAPLSIGSKELDVNLSADGNQGRLGNTPACQVKEVAGIKSCDLVKKPAIIIPFVVGNQACLNMVVRADSLASKYRKINFLALAVRTGLNAAAEVKTQQKWSLQVAYDRDGALAKLLQLPFCPALLATEKGGTITDHKIGKVGPAELESLAKKLSGKQPKR